MIKTNTYIASVRCGETNEITVIERDYSTKKQFREDLRGNGFRVRYISTPVTFDEDTHKYHEKLERDRRHAQIRRDVRKKYSA